MSYLGKRKLHNFLKQKGFNPDKLKNFVYSRGYNQEGCNEESLRSNKIEILCCDRTIIDVYLSEVNNPYKAIIHVTFFKTFVDWEIVREIQSKYKVDI